MRPITNDLISYAAPGCNLDGDYCFHRKNMQSYPRQAPRMSETVLKTLLRQMQLHAVPNLSGWLGSETTLIRLIFYHKAVEYTECDRRDDEV